MINTNKMNISDSSKSELEDLFQNQYLDSREHTYQSTCQNFGEDLYQNQHQGHGGDPNQTKYQFYRKGTYKSKVQNCRCCVEGFADIHSLKRHLYSYHNVTFCSWKPNPISSHCNCTMNQTDTLSEVNTSFLAPSSTCEVEPTINNSSFGNSEFEKCSQCQTLDVRYSHRPRIRKKRKYFESNMSRKSSPHRGFLTKDPKLQTEETIIAVKAIKAKPESKSGHKQFSLAKTKKKNRKETQSKQQDCKYYIDEVKDTDVNHSVAQMSKSVEYSEYKCGECHAAFSAFALLSEHMDIHVQETLRSNPKEDLDYSMRSTRQSQDPPIEELSQTTKNNRTAEMIYKIHDHSYAKLPTVKTIKAKPKSKSCHKQCSLSRTRKNNAEKKGSVKDPKLPTEKTIIAKDSPNEQPSQNVEKNKTKEKYYEFRVQGVNKATANNVVEIKKAYVGTEFQCAECYEKYPSEWTLITHMRSHVGGKSTSKRANVRQEESKDISNSCQVETKSGLQLKEVRFQLPSQTFGNKQKQEVKSLVNNPTVDNEKIQSEEGFVKDAKLPTDKTIIDFKTIQAKAESKTCHKQFSQSILKKNNTEETQLKQQGDINKLTNTHVNHPVAQMSKPMEYSKYNCSECDAVFSAKAALQEHMNIHTQESLRDDPQEDIVFSVPNTRQNKDPPNEGSRQKVGKLKTTEINYKIHVKEVNNGTTNDFVETLKAYTDREFQCTECNNKFSSEWRLITHMQSHLREKEQQEQSIVDFFSLHKHPMGVYEEIPSEKRCLNCYICGKEFTVVTDLLAHIEMHALDRKHVPKERNYVAEEGNYVINVRYKNAANSVSWENIHDEETGMMPPKDWKNDLKSKYNL